jgi:ABC-type multidrug transport system fused ATPase/permease subunit
VELNAYRLAVAYAPQEAFLFSDTIKANIAFARPQATPAEIVEVARAVGIHDEIMGLTEGYQSRIGEKGVMLSGGQRQRISLARALLAQAAILIIDDGLSAVDSGTERHIMAAIEEYAQSHIVFMATHRLTPLAQAREVMVLQEGRLVAIGSHQQLMQQSEYYRAIFHKQTEPTSGGQDHAA